MARYRVIAPVVVVKTQGDFGMQWKHLQQGAPVPDDAEEEWIGYHLRDKMIAEIPDDAPPAAAPLPEGEAGPLTAQPSTHPDETPAPPAEAEAKPAATRRGAQRAGG